MATVTIQSTSAGVETVAIKRFNPARWWAKLGAFFLLFEVYVLGSWILSGDPARTLPGPDPVPTRMKVAIVVMSIVGVVGTIAIVYRVVWRGYRRHGRLTTDGLICLAFCTIWWQDPIVNYAQNWVGVNAWAWNFGSWVPHIPGALAGNSKLFVEAPLWDWTMYAYGVFGMLIPGNYLMRRAKARWNLGPIGLMAVCFLFFAIVDFVAEPIFMWIGLFTYPGAVRELTIFAGKYYQYPLYEVILWPFVWTAWASLRYFRDDRGHTLAERGVDELRATPKQKTGIRFLGIVGFVNLTFMVLYNIPFAFFALNGDPWPQDVLKRSYFTNGLCGPGTTYACSSEKIPIPRPGSVRVDPDGRLVGPDGKAAP